MKQSAAVAAVVGLLSFASLSLAPTAASLDTFIVQKMNEARIPGLEAILVKHGRTIFTQGYGYADLAGRVPVTGDTAFRVASVSKTFTATALMSFYDRGLIHLDDDVSSALPFTVRNPRFPGMPITYRMLLTHTASIADNYDAINSLWNWQGDARTPLATLMHDYFAPDGRLFDTANFLAVAPGTVSQYSNLGLALAGYLAEVLGAKPFATVVQERVLTPLGLRSAGWSVQGPLPQGGLATLYDWQERRAHFTAMTQYGYPEVPAGMLHISGNDLSRFLNLYIGGGALDGVRVLQSNTVAEMRRVQYPAVADNQGLVFYYLSAPGRARKLIGHNGSDPGVAAEMYWVDGDPAGLGVIMLANADVDGGDSGDGEKRSTAFYAILSRLLEFGESL